MQAINFEESNFVFKKPSDMTEEQCNDLQVFAGQYANGVPVIISCWKPSEEELQEINKTGEVWLHVLGTGTPPVLVQGHSPFKNQVPDVQS